MWIDSIVLKNVRAIPDATLKLSRGINILVGPNNAGKSTVLLPLLSLQEGLRMLDYEDVRLGTSDSFAEIAFAEQDMDLVKKKYDRIAFSYNKQRQFVFVGTSTNANKSAHEGLPRFPGSEPRNFIYPFVSKRKVTALSEHVNQETVMKVPSDFENLNAKIDRLANPDFLPAHDIYMRACRDILGFRVTTAHTGQGKRAVYTVRNLHAIPLLAMGEGVMNILGLVANLALAENKLFVIEEPENDIHPRALKALMDLLTECAHKNQFVITTHSNIVVKKLGTVKDARIFNVAHNIVDRMPTATVTQVDDTTEARQAVLRDLGYEMSDSDLWDAWLFLEESSAERVVRQFFIPWFTPRLQGRLRTYAAHSISEVAAKFADFNNLFVYLHLEPAYKNRVWVVVDGGHEEADVINRLIGTYTASGWRADQFLQLQQHDFEKYYPDVFQEQVTAALQLENKRDRREAKKKLLETVLGWIAEDEPRAKDAFAKSAAEVVEILKRIDSHVK